VVDTYGAALRWFVDEGVALIRVNRRELEPLSPLPSRTSPGELLRVARDRHRARRWATTDGKAPVWFIDENHDPESIPSPSVREISPTGSGDVMLACVLHGRFQQGLSWRDAVVWSLPYAAANAAHPGVAEFPDPARIP
jgi:fructose-1-phosphate kinase PfkB-like protein